MEYNRNIILYTSCFAKHGWERRKLFYSAESGSSIASAFTVCVWPVKLYGMRYRERGKRG
jgi:hypothetical protein